MKQRQYAPEVLDAFRSGLSAMIERPKPKPLTSESIVDATKQELLAALARGYAVEDVLAIARQSGFSISEGWLRRLMVKTGITDRSGSNGKAGGSPTERSFPVVSGKRRPE